MAKILVKKSAPKGVLVKQVQPQLMQSPAKSGKSFMDFLNTFRNKNKTPGVGVKQKLASLAGMAGKVGAGLSTVNDTMQAMQGGNVSAPLGMGYTFEAKDPTGRMISEAANPNPQPAPRAKVNQVALPQQQQQPAAPAPAAPAPAAPAPAAPVMPPMPQQMPRLGGGHPNLSAVPPNMPPLPPPPPPSAYGISVPQPQPVQQPQQPVQQPQQPMQQSMTTQTPEQIERAKNALLTNEQMAEKNQQYAQVPPYAHEVSNMNNTIKQSFVTALTEKLGADIVYKMTPHQMGTFAAYSLLKLR